MLSLSEDTLSDVIETFNSTSWYLDDLLNIDNNFFVSMVKSQSVRYRGLILDLHLSMSDGFVKT